MKSPEQIDAETTRLLDHGYIIHVGTWGSDEQIIEAARMSTGKGFLGWGGDDPCPECKELGRFDSRDKLYRDAYQATAGRSCKTCRGSGTKPGDEKLLRYLWENKHHTPFEMGGMTLEVQAPIFVFREWHRHRVPFSYNEMSARYIPLPDLSYVPSVDRLMANAGSTNKQAGTIVEAKPMTEATAEWFREQLEVTYKCAQELYEQALRNGVPKELARVHLPVGRYSRMRVSSNVRGWLNFLSLRMAPGAQYEIRTYANEVGRLLGERFPRTWELFSERLP